MVYRCIRYWFILFVILMFGFFTPYDVQAELTNEIMEQEAISGRENMVLVQYISGFDSRRNMAADRAVRSRCAINPEVELLELDESVDTAEYIMKLKENPHVRFVERNKKLRLFSFPNDPYYSSQWALTQIQAVEAWELLPPGQQDIIVAVIDSGIKSNHLDLCNRISPGGYNFLLNNHDINDVQGHGTAVAGVIAAETNNGIGIAGVAGPNRVKILPLKTSDSEGYSYLSDVIAAIDYAIEQQVKVINISMGSPKYSEIENAAIQRAINKGICVVAAAGNDGNSSYNYPASHPGVISVGSIKPDCLVSHFSNYNDKVDLTAPGEDVYSCSYDGSYRSVTGTSFSAPIVSATAALLITANPALTPSEIENILGQSAVDLGTPGKDPYYGYGVVNAFSALEQIVQVPVSSISLDKEALELQVGESYTLAATIYPTNASNPQIAWASDNTDVATVDANGKVTAISEGNATIIAVSADGGKIASCYLTVIPDYIAVEELLLDKQQLLLQVGESYALQAGLNPFNATIKEVSWATDNPAVQSVSLNQSSVSFDKGKSIQLEATVLPTNATNKAVSWASSNPAVVSVDSNGLVTGVGVGTAAVAVTTVDGNKTASCSVTVEEPFIAVESVSLNKSSTELFKGETETLAATIFPANATNHQLGWVSSNTSVATVDSNGLVTAINPGTATISTVTADGGKIASCSVNVTLQLLTTLIQEQLHQNLGSYFIASTTDTTVDAIIQSGKRKTNIRDVFTIELVQQMLSDIDEDYQLQRIDIGSSSYTGQDILENIQDRADEIKKDIVLLADNNNISSYEEIKLEDLAGKSITLVFAGEEIGLKLCLQDECFIATAAFGSKLQPAVVLLRQFRDKALLTNSLGQAFVAFYYQHSPPIAQYIAGNEAAKLIVKILLIPIIGMAYIVMNPVISVFILLLLLLAVLYRRRVNPQS